MSIRDRENNTNKERGVWRIWDALFLSSAISVIKDSEDARKDKNKFKKLIVSWIFAIIITIIIFVILWWIIMGFINRR